MESKLRTVSMRVPIDIYNKIEQLAEKDGRAISNYIAVIIFPEFLNEIEKKMEMKKNDHSA